ncbi:MAG: response regulator [Myxococcota bacterium]
MPRRPLVLLVEDDPDDELLALRALGNANIPHEVVVCRSGQEAVDYLCGPGCPASLGPDRVPALVLLDLKMPGMGGFEVLKRVRCDGVARYVPIVIASSSDEPADVHRACALGANAYVRKTADPAGKVARASAVLRFWLEVNVWDRSRISDP